MKILTKSKRSTESDTDTKKTNRWFRARRSSSSRQAEKDERGEIDQLFDLYWGGEERRITGMTLRILGVNLIAVFGLLIGVIYLGQYHSTLIESKLLRFETELLLTTASITHGAVTEENDTEALSIDKVEDLSARLGATLDKQVIVFDHDGRMIADSKALIEKHGIRPFFQIVKSEKRTLNSIEMLKSTAGWITSFFPKYNELPLFQGIAEDDALTYHDVRQARARKMSVSAWRDKERNIILTAALPIINDGEMYGVVMMVGADEGIREAVGDMWFSILKIFLVTLFITILLSIYLSGVIARPLRKLADAAERVRQGKLKHTEIPDMSERHDEIGELSMVLRDMTQALWDRMDSIESFAADVSHEIKNPLTSLKSAVETAAIVKKEEDRNKLLEIINHDIQRLDRLITDISKASRLDAELSRESFGKVNLKQLLRDLLDAYKNPLERERSKLSNQDQVDIDGVQLILDMPDNDRVIVMGSEGRLIQVFQNIISNALSFSAQGTKITVQLSVQKERAHVSITDQGGGIPENKLESIFERFYSERPDHEEYGRHSGLGLSICKQIIDAHSGVIYAENAKSAGDDASQGARFTVVLNMV